MTGVSGFIPAWRFAIRLALVGAASLLFVLVLAQQADAASESPGTQPEAVSQAQNGDGAGSSDEGSGPKASPRSSSREHYPWGRHGRGRSHGPESSSSSRLAESDAPLADPAADALALDPAPASDPTLVAADTTSDAGMTTGSDGGQQGISEPVSDGDSQPASEPVPSEPPADGSTATSSSDPAPTSDPALTTDDSATASSTTTSTDPVLTTSATADTTATTTVTTDATATADTTATTTATTTEVVATAAATPILACASPAPAVAMTDLTVLAPVLPEVVGPIAMVQRLNSLLQQGLAVARAISWTSPGSSLTDVLEQVGNLAGHTGRDERQRSGAPPLPAPLPASVPAPVPLPTSLPTLPTEQGGGSGSGSSIGSGSHGHGKGGGSYAVLGGIPLVVFLRPLGVSRRLRSSGYSRSLQPLVLPG